MPAFKVHYTVMKERTVFAADAAEATLVARECIPVWEYPAGNMCQLVEVLGKDKEGQQTESTLSIFNGTKTISR